MMRDRLVLLSVASPRTRLAAMLCCLFHVISFGTSGGGRSCVGLKHVAAPRCDALDTCSAVGTACCRGRGPHCLAVALRTHRPGAPPRPLSHIASFVERVLLILVVRGTSGQRQGSILVRALASQAGLRHARPQIGAHISGHET